MAEKDTVFSSSIKYNGIFSFKDFYKFCYDWITDEMDLKISEDKYEEKLAGETKEILVDWTCSKKLTDYFKFEAKVSFVARPLQNVQITEGGAKISTNKGGIKVSIKGVLVRDYDGKFETTAFKKFMRSVYEKWIIPSRVDQFQDKIIGNCDEFLSQSKAYLDLEGKR
jgi:hypothetical protein